MAGELTQVMNLYSNIAVGDELPRLNPEFTESEQENIVRPSRIARQEYIQHLVQNATEEGIDSDDNTEFDDVSVAESESEKEGESNDNSNDEQTEVEDDGENMNESHRDFKPITMMP